jgi:lipid-binding SYLF domain-containing protein
MKAVQFLVAGWLLALCSACVWQPVAYDSKAEASVQGAVAAFHGDEALQPFFDEAVAYAVFPSSVRAGTGLGGAFGLGWMSEGDEITGRVVMAEFFAGANLGVQAYRSILFFRTEESLKDFKHGNFEFTGQANVAHVVGGKAITPAFNQQVAMFVQVRGGLLLEASVGSQRYDFFPLADVP